MATAMRCWWCRDSFAPDQLVHLEGARIAGSPPLSLPDRLPEPVRVAMVVCHPCAVTFAGFRIRHDNERAEAGAKEDPT